MSAMTYRDILLPLFTYPDTLPEAAMRTAASIAARLGAAAEGEVTAMALEVRIKPARNRLANLLAGIDELVRQENAANVQRALTAGLLWKEIASERALNSRSVVQPVELYCEAGVLAEAARTRDICLISVGPRVEIDRSVAESVLFGSGRPVLVFPEDGDVGQAATFERVVVAWDGSRSASRALADALPLLKQATEVRILTVVNEKASATAGMGEGVVRHLARHGVKAGIDEVAAAGRSIGTVLETHVTANADLLVMGGFGHSRARDFLLGGATQSVLHQPRGPVFLSH
ncbi:universal stress protein [Brevundimonas sp. UBA2416]|uniref:universal stress protein n=1 Tax=Brevundimonas sp. UBA2416 TaxID=1946124 RepID=UPI0025C0FE12|nr:universal stress protein [Brevundimonas sp. UBA2416]HRJ63457.1 universal stress protein [Brevundimonas sp.]